MSREFDYMPVCLRLKNQKCLVIGGGRVALRKINTLRKFGADVTCLSPEFVKQIKRLKIAGKIKHIKAKYSAKVALNDYKLVIAATNDSYVNRRIAEHTQRKRVLVNIVDRSAQGDVIMPAILKKGSLLVAVSTGGRNPSQAKKIRDSLRNAV